jgi:hypothetical protein
LARSSLPWCIVLSSPDWSTKLGPLSCVEVDFYPV